MKRIILILLLTVYAWAVSAQRWSLDENGIVWDVASSEQAPHEDHLEMAGERVACQLRWKIDEDKGFYSEKTLIFPSLRRIPNNTYGSLKFRLNSDVLPLLNINGSPMPKGSVEMMRINGMVEVRSHCANPNLIMIRTIFPSTAKPVVFEKFVLKNGGDKRITVNVPEYSTLYRTDPAKGLDGVTYIVRCDVSGSGFHFVEPGDEISFSAVYQAYPEDADYVTADADEEYALRMAFVEKTIGDNLVLETPDPIIDRMFHFAKIRASESIFATKGGYMHGPGGGLYYAAIWANDQAEYANPFFPFVGYELGNKSALNSFLHYARFMNDDFKPLPCSIIAEGTDIWNKAGDRGDAAMVAYGAGRYALARGDRKEAEQLWPLIEWCLEYCRRNLNDEGVVISDTDELEGRAYVGKTNLNTSTLYYDALLSASYLAKDLGIKNSYKKQAEVMAKNIKRYFTADIKGYETYRYYEGNTTLRSWICTPLIVGFNERAAGTVDALLGPELRMDDGLLTEEGDKVFWDRSTLYAIRGIYYAGYADRANEFMHSYSKRRLLGDHVPYAVEAYPENSQVHLSAESALYCRAMTEGLFGITPVGFKSFTMKVTLPDGWDNMSLKRVCAFGTIFDIDVTRISGNKVLVTIVQNGRKIREYRTDFNKSIKVRLNDE